MKIEDDVRPHGVEVISTSSAIETKGLDKNPVSPLMQQYGGNHYKGLAIEPVEYAYKNNLDFFQGNVVKYITRFRDKNGLEDLKKAKHFIDLLIQFEYSEEGDSCQNKREGCGCTKGKCTCKTSIEV